MAFGWANETKHLYPVEELAWESDEAVIADGGEW